jgi:hypothetical protein
MHMKTNNQKEGDTSGMAEENQVKKLLVLAAVGLRLARKILDKLQSIEVSIEIIAQEIARQSERGK